MLSTPTVHRWARQLDALHARIAPHVGRPEPRRRARASLETLLAGAERRKGWQLAEAAGEATPYGMQRLIAAAAWTPRCSTTCAPTSSSTSGPRTAC